MAIDMKTVKSKGYLIFVIATFIFFVVSNLVGMRYAGSQSDKWSPEAQGQSHK